MTPTPAPTPTPGCIDGLKWVADLSYDDQNMKAPPVLQPGQAFVKGWRVQNAGTCSWTPGFYLNYTRGNTPAAQMGGQPTAITREVRPGETYDIQVNLVAPITPGVYQGFWNMHNAKGVAFGETIWVGIQVLGAPTPTPLPTQTPAPNIQFTADRTSIRAGEPVQFCWEVQNVRAVYFYAQGQPWEENGVTGKECRTVYPTTTTVYELRVINPDGSTEIRQIRIDVQPTVGAPIITRFTVYPDTQVSLGQCVQLQWEIQGEVNFVRITANGVSIWDGAPLQGVTQHCPQQLGTVAYAVEASGPGGSNRAQHSVNVVQSPPTPAPGGPVITAFSVSPTQFPLGQCTSISWSVTGDIRVVRLFRNGSVILDNAPTSSWSQDCPAPPGQYTYRLEATGPSGQIDAREAAVWVQ